MKTISFTCLQRMYYSAMWAADAAMANGITSECVRYWKIANRIEKAMHGFKTNEFRRELA